MNKIQIEKIQLAVEAVLVVAVIALFVLFFTNKKSASTTPEAAASQTTEKPKAPAIQINESEIIPVAYLDLDSLLQSYTFAQEAHEQLLKKQEDARMKINGKAQTLQKEMQEFQRKLETNAFLSRERAESEQQKLLKKEQDLNELYAQLNEDFVLEQQKINKQLQDTLNNFLQEYNADGRYHIILSNTMKDNVLWAADSYNITTEVIEQLNKRYK